MRVGSRAYREKVQRYLAWPEHDRRSGPDRRVATQRVIDAAKNAYLQITSDEEGPPLDAAITALGEAFESADGVH